MMSPFPSRIARASTPPSHGATRLLSGLTAVVLVLLCSGWSLLAAAQPPAHFSECTTRTGANATVIFSTDAHVTVDENAIAVGDEIAVFTPEGHCVGVTTWTGSNMALTVWGADAFTPEGKALETGEPMIFRVWDTSTGREFGGEAAFTLSLSQHAAYLTADNRFVPDGIYVVDTLRLAPSPQASR